MISSDPGEGYHQEAYRADCGCCEWAVELHCKRNMIESIAERHRSRTDHVVTVEDLTADP